MFTGIITDLGRILAIEAGGMRRFRLATAYPVEGIAIGASIACNGVCLSVTDKGPGGNAATPCTPAVVDQLTEQCDVALTGSADCGSCTSWSVHDTIQLEHLGIPTVVATTTGFVELTRRVAAGFGLPDARIAVFPHPLGGTDDDTILTWADAAVDEVVALLTRR